MSQPRQFTFDVQEQFSHLDRAPIVEAVIHWRARSEKAFERERLLEGLKASLPDYPTVRPQQEVQLEAQIGPEGAAQAQRASWHGFRLESKDQRYIAQFTRNGFIFSRVAPYENWDRFVAEARRLWQIHVELTAPSEIERLGVRFINRIVPVDFDKMNEILAKPPQCPSALTLPISEFLHRTRFNIPGHPYNINIIQATQPPGPPETEALSLILDIDVFTTKTTELEDAALDARLREMRWLKNKAFYSLLTEQAIERFKEAHP